MFGYVYVYKGAVCVHVCVCGGGAGGSMLSEFILKFRACASK